MGRCPYCGAGSDQPCRSICSGGYVETPAEPDEVVWLRDLDGTGSMHPCTPDCPGAIRYIREDLA